MDDFGRQYVEAARELLNVPWQHQGRGNYGLDCIGLCVFAAQKLGINLPDMEGYPRRQSSNLLQRKLSQNLKMVSLSAWKSGDIGLFLETGHPVHVGILVRGNGNTSTVIHAHARRRKVVEEKLETYGRPHAVYRIEGTV